MRDKNSQLKASKYLRLSREFQSNFDLRVDGGVISGTN